MRWPLRYQILVPFAGAMLAVVVVESVLAAYLAARRTQERIEQQLHGIAQTLLDTNFPLTDAVLKQTRGLSGAEFAVVDESGRLLAATLHAVDLSAIPRAQTRGSKLTLDQPLEIGGQPYFHTAVAVRPRAEQAVPTFLHILYPRRDLVEARWQAAYPPLLLGGALLGVVIVLAILIAGRLSRPILELRRQLSRLVQGDYQPVPLPQRNDELRELVESCNVLADQLAESRRAIERSERLALLGQLSGGLAHQLRNSVTGARIAVQLHQRRCDGQDEDSLAVALRQLTLTESHLQRFLTVGQPFTPRPGSCNLRAVVDDVGQLVGPACRHHNVDLQIAVEPTLQVPVQADAEQVRQLLLNLVLNAIEAAGAGGWVRVEFDRRDAGQIVRVLDSGAGPDPALCERLFEPFVTGKPEGIGLGLAVAQRIAEVHGGTLRYLPGRPTCFEVVLPPANDRAPLERPAEPQVTEKPNHAPLPKETPLPQETPWKVESVR
ncbi:MAG: ATP-binding protein [Pirellulales bacterium]